MSIDRLKDGLHHKLPPSNKHNINLMERDLIDLLGGKK